MFSVDTPPPYVSAAHLHVGHAMSYSQPDFIVRYRRMRGERVFYPIGFDDNGLPTERYVEQVYGVRAVDMPRAEFVALCLAKTAPGPTVRRTWSGPAGCRSTLVVSATPPSTPAGQWAAPPRPAPLSMRVSFEGPGPDLCGARRPHLGRWPRPIWWRTWSGPGPAPSAILRIDRLHTITVRSDELMGKYGADALRLWATKGRIGTDLRYNEKDIRTGRKFAVKLWNVGRFLSMNLGDLTFGWRLPRRGSGASWTGGCSRTWPTR